MLTKNEVATLNLSPTKKDFVQIWNELLEIAGKLSERWDPTSTNESDPGIVILKALTGIADKLNYNIDKNTLEAFMPTAAQEDSMRKLCDMLGYNIKYYRSAETTVTIRYYNSEPTEKEEIALRGGLRIPKFTVITNSDRDINYFTNNEADIYISSTTPSVSLPCMEGQIVKCESTSDNNIITASQISENNRFYMPEVQIAENGIFVYNVAFNQKNGEAWKKVDNLNIQERRSRVFKFGYDSYSGRPYIEFPEDYSELINDGLFIYYARTSGANGNVSPRTLTQVELPSGDGWNDVSAGSFSAENAFSATSGANIETISQAYNNFKKTIGTFDTLVTCRDYMNKIYALTDDDTSKPLVSNILVTDIRNDLNRAVTICSCDDAGIFYKDVPLFESNILVNSNTSTENTPEVILSTTKSTANKPVFNANRRVNNSSWFLGSKDGIPLVKADFIYGGNSSSFNATTDGDVVAEDGFWHIYQPKGYRTWNCKTNLPVEDIPTAVETHVKTITNTITKTVENKQAIDHFDLVFYPFKSYNQIRSNVKDIQEVYDASFTYNNKNLKKIATKLEDCKTVSHNIKEPNPGDLISINNYLRLNAIIGTNSKVTVEEGTLLVDTIKIALANAFNMRELDFGEEIPFDSIVEVIENADARIKVVSLAEPALYTTFSVLDKYTDEGIPVLREYAVASNWLSTDSAYSTGRFDYGNEYTFDSQEAKKIYNKLAVRNVLAGRVPLFKYNDTFKTSFSEGAYKVTEQLSSKPTEVNLENPTAEKPFTMIVDGTAIYTGQRIVDDTDPDNPKVETVYTKTYTPNAPTDYTNNIITKTGENNNIIEIKTSCVINPDTDAAGQSTDNISDVTLAAGEVIKFRAPNFTTDKTYPAYVNYNLTLQNGIERTASAAKAYTLHSLMNMQLDGRGLPPDERRQRALNYFTATKHKQTFALTQKVSKKVSDSLEKEDDFTFIKIENSSTIVIEETPEAILAKSGFIKLADSKPTLAWVDGPTNSQPDLDIPALDLGDSMFIVNAGVFTNIKNRVDEYLNYLNTNYSEKLPVDYDWTISYTFEYIPFEETTLAEWKNFILSNGRLLFGFYPVEENDVAFWHTTAGGYELGKYVRSDTTKLLAFTRGDFGFLDSFTTRLLGVYIAEDLGSDKVANVIENDEEYMLRAGEYLYIEYTPSSTTEDGTSQTKDSVKEVHGPGTIIKPSGFENGLMDSKVYEDTGHSSHKATDFENVKSVNMFSLGASEQIEIRDFAHVLLNKETLPNETQIFVYKNFTNCPQLETIATDGTGLSGGKRINNSYTLKDGEYIFYTDQNKAEFAYFTNGTEVTLYGSTIIPPADSIDLSTIFDNGIQEIPWEQLPLTRDNGINFQEFQYVTLGEGDTLNRIFLAGSRPLSDSWQACSDVEYTLVDGTKDKLPKINLSNTADGGNGWEASSILELRVTPETSQTLRKTDKIETKVTLKYSDKTKVDLEAKDSEHPISFKANLPCQTSNSALKITDLYTNPDNLKSFELKVFAEEPPAVIKTRPGTLIPYIEDNKITSKIDLANWPAEQPLSVDDFDTTWKPIALSNMSSNEIFDSALKLAVSTLPNTYGIFSVYINYRGTEATNAQTWIELLPGVNETNVELFNRPTRWVQDELTVGDNDEVIRVRKLMLSPGINCIRINNTSDIFIKTKATDGALYFDSIRLVDCRPVEYIENGYKVSKATQGLNLQQIGYLDTSDEGTFSVFDMHIRKKLKEEFTADALAKLDARADEEADTFTAIWNDLLSTKENVQDLVDFITNAKAEIEKLTKSDVNDTLFKTDEELKDLFGKYKDIYTQLEREKKLKAAFDANSSIDELEQQLADLFESINNAELVRTELLDELDKLEKASKDNVVIFDKDKMSKGDILDDFDATADVELYPLLVSDLKLASIAEINANFASNLADILAAVENADEKDGRESLINILEAKNISKHSSLLTYIQELLNKNQETLEDLLDKALTATSGQLNTSTGKYEVNYSELNSILLNMRVQLSSTDIKEIISRIEVISNSSLIAIDKYSKLSILIDELSQLAEGENVATAAGNYSSLIADINTILVSVQAKIAASAVDLDNSIVNAIENLYNNTSKIYIRRILAVLANIKTILDDIETDYSEAFKTLDTSTKESFEEAIDQLSIYTDNRSVNLALVDTFTEDDILNYEEKLPYGEQSVLAVWLKYMKRAFIVGIDSIYRSIRAAITGKGLTEFVIDASFYDNSGTGELRLALSTAADLDAFKRLFDRANDQVQVNIQNTKRKSLINELAALIKPSDELKNAMDALDDEAEQNAVLSRLITEFKTTSVVTNQQQLISEIKKELDHVINIDTKLEEICAKLLCPSLLLVESNKKIAENSAFFKRFYNFASEKKQHLLLQSSGFNSELAIIVSELDNAIEITGALSVAMNTGDVTKFDNSKWENITETDESFTLLSKDYLKKLLELKYTLDIQSLIAKIKGSKLFDFLKEDFVIAWEHGDNNWVDGTGKPVNKDVDKWHTADGDFVQLKRYNNGMWEDCRGETSTEITIKDDGGKWLIEDEAAFLITDEELSAIIEGTAEQPGLLEQVSDLGNNNISESFKKDYSVLILEERLLQEISDMDKTKDFYYNVPIESNFAIDFTEADSTANTLMNPAMNYDINNVNNNFVISKIDINYLTKGIKIARSSRFN